MWIVCNECNETQIKGSKHAGQWNYTINVIELYILSDCEYNSTFISLIVSKFYTHLQNPATYKININSLGIHSPNFSK
jgi:hypothetical protein